MAIKLSLSIFSQRLARPLRLNIELLPAEMKKRWILPDNSSLARNNIA